MRIYSPSIAVLRIWYYEFLVVGIFNLSLLSSAWTRAAGRKRTFQGRRPLGNGTGILQASVDMGFSGGKRVCLQIRVGVLFP